MGEDEIRMEQSKVIVKSNNIELGEDAAEKLILGDTFLSFFNSHTHPTPSGPSSIPTVLMTSFQHLSGKNSTQTTVKTK